jgi:hypothetical protein
MAAFRLGSAIQDGIDEAKTKEADVAAGRGMQAVTDKYMAMIGKDAEVNYDAMQAELSQAGQSAMGMLDNDVQRRMLSPILARNMGIFQSRMGQHRVQQLRVYQTNEATARAELSADYAIQAYSQRSLKDAEGRPVGLINYAANADTAIAEIRKAGELMGYAPDSAQMKQLEQKVYDRMAVGIVNGLMAEKEYAQASEFLSDSATVESLDAKTRQALADSVDANRQRSVVGELASSIKNMGLLVSKSDPETYWQQKDGPVEPPTTLRDALVLSEQIKDDQTRKFVQAELRTQFAQDDALIEQEYNINVENILQFLAVPGNTAADIPADQFGRLRPVDRQKIMAGQKSRKDLLVQEEIAIDPSKYATVDAVDKIRMDISPQLYIKLRERLNQPEKIIEATVDAEETSRILYDFGMDAYVAPAPGSDEKKARLILNDSISMRLTSEQTQRGGKLAPEERRRIIKEMVLDKAYIPDWFTDTEMPYEMMTQEQRSTAYYMRDGKPVLVQQEKTEQAQGERDRDAAIQALQRAGIAQPRPDEIARYLERKRGAR